ncbi:aminotransferase class I/II-fold pyridoxal phosphate-dependent enzyme [Sphingomonas colocasiae]|uniref:Aminotransferase n=1 Tax=Sphingomonas colocasiae TaxID=1848973 RepID=A0ABS7PR12_9SPHN|nr:aminotransferase class I/II-fold pyridoxal phosphate-dependent enzyme [Sphingomonas colocasiae]MBY8823621.1 aminotransferase class I/II-fold pyridoxal phosphate-dependent enzyme [Sphingomonas colocasiae]
MNGRWTFHGGRLGEARAVYGDAAGPWLDLSTGINPHGWASRDGLGTDAIAIDWRALPDEDGLRALERAAAASFGVDPGFVCALPGTEIGLRLIGGLLPGPARHVAPAYRTHGEIFAGSVAIAFDAIDTLSAGTLVIANPNNPDGRIVAPQALAAHLSRLSAASGWLVVDEAFADAVPEASVAGLVADDRPLVIFRSFGKFFGLAGLRLGFVIGPRALIARFRAALGSWPVSAAALAIGAAAYRDLDWAGDMRARLLADAAALDAVLGGHGLRPIGACPLFRLVETDRAAALFDRLARRGILTRPFDHDPRWLRFGLAGSDAALGRLDRALGDG